jgi:hypothetical protein
MGFPRDRTTNHSADGLGRYRSLYFVYIGDRVAVYAENAWGRIPAIKNGGDVPIAYITPQDGSTVRGSKPTATTGTGLVVSYTTTTTTTTTTTSKGLGLNRIN